MTKYFYILLFLGLNLFVYDGLAQRKMQVVTRITEESFTFSKEFWIEINAEKANIKIIEGPEQKVNVVLKQSVKNSNPNLLKKHIEGHRYVFKNEKDKLYLRNYLLFKGDYEESSSLFVSNYEITVPKNCKIKIVNQLGDISIAGITGEFWFQVDYGKVMLEQCKGVLNAKLKIGDLTLRNCNFQAELETQNVITKINGCGGDFDIESSFGSMSIVLNEENSRIAVDSENTELTFINKENILFNYDISNKNGAINVIGDEEIVKEGDWSILKSQSDNAVGGIKIIAEYGDVSIY